MWARDVVTGPLQGRISTVAVAASLPPLGTAPLARYGRMYAVESSGSAGARSRSNAWRGSSVGRVRSTSNRDEETAAAVQVHDPDLPRSPARDRRASRTPSSPSSSLDGKSLPR